MLFERRCVRFPKSINKPFVTTSDFCTKKIRVKFGCHNLRFKYTIKEKYSIQVFVHSSVLLLTIFFKCWSFLVSWEESICRSSARSYWWRSIRPSKRIKQFGLTERYYRVTAHDFSSKTTSMHVWLSALFHVQFQLWLFLWFSVKSWVLTWAWARKTSAGCSAPSRWARPDPAALWKTRRGEGAS